MTLTNIYFFKMVPSNRLFPIITHIAFTFRWKWGNLSIVGVAVGIAWATGSAVAVGVAWEGGASLEGSIT